MNTFVVNDSPRVGSLVSKAERGGNVDEAFTICRTKSARSLKHIDARHIYLRERHRQTSRRVDLAEQDIGNTVADFVTTVEGLNEGVRLIEPRHSDGHAGLSDNHSVRVGGKDGFHQVVLRSRKAMYGSIPVRKKIP